MLRRLLACVAVPALGGAGFAFLPISTAAGGASLAVTVDTTADDGSLSACSDAPADCSLRGALEGYANDNHVDGQTIDVTVPAGEYALLDEIRMFEANVNVHGAGVDETIVTTDLSENLLVRHLELNPDGELVVILSDMTFADGAQGTAGGSIRARNGVPLTLRRMHFVDNAVRGNGGAIAVEGNQLSQTLVVEDTTFVGNSATEHGGAVWVGNEETATITNSTFTGNGAAFGGAVAVGHTDATMNASAELVHVTISGNGAMGVQGDASTAGGGIAVGIGAHASIEGTVIENSTEVEVSAPSQPEGAGVAAVGDPIANCFVSGGGELSSDGQNVVDDDTCHLDQASDHPDTAAEAQDLADNGGPTFTMALLASSPAVDAAGDTCAVSDDQRGVSRPQDGDGDGTTGCDAGAFERAADEPEEPPAARPTVVTPRFTG